MEWYKGGIADAVTLSRQNGAIFVVYIEGTDEGSEQMTQLVNSPEVSRLLNNKHFVAVHVKANSVTHQQFSEIYRQSVAPSVYFIGKTGMPIQILTTALEPKEMVRKINEIVVENGDKPIDIEPLPDLCKNEPHPEPSTSAKEENKLITTEDKLKLAQELIAKKRREKEEEEKAKEREKEVERRKMGQDVQNLKRWQQDQELKSLMEEREKAKREDREARERVRRQIEEDKREKAARLNQFVSAAPSTAEPVAPRQVMHGNTARLQFRLPNGMHEMREFKSSARLQEVIDYVTNTLNLSNFVLSTTFPRREFTQQDANQTLHDLQLVPNAAMLVLPSNRGGQVANTNSAGISGFLWFLFGPIVSLVDYIKNFIFGTPRRPTVDPTGPPTPPAQQYDNPTPHSAPGTSEVRKRAMADKVRRQQSNIHRLHENDSDEDNNTWNGNSTQQM